MRKGRKWQFISILAVAVLTIYNILPTLFFYSKPLADPLSKSSAEKSIVAIEQRIDQMSQESVDWILSYCKHIGISPKKVSPNSGSIAVEFTKTSDAEKFRSYVQRAASLISFSPARLTPSFSQEDPKSVILNRQIPIHLQENKGLFSWVSKKDPEYRKMVIERSSQIAWNLIEGEKKGLTPKTIKAMLSQENQFSFEGTKLWIDFSLEKICFSLKNNETLIKISRDLGEKVLQSENGFEIPFHLLADTSSSIVLHLDTLSKLEINQALSSIKTKWHPKHPDLQNIPIVDADNYPNLTLEEKALCLVFVSPFSEDAKNLSKGSLYLFVKGIERIQKTYEGFQDSPLASALEEDLEALHLSLYETGFLRADPAKDAPYSADFQFEKPDFAAPIIQASRENFHVNADKRHALLELSTHEQRIIAQNKIDNTVHEELIKWRDDYKASQVNLDPKVRFDVPKPTKNVLWNNVMLTLRKMVRGDENRIIRWGLDLSGGKSVELELLDSKGEIVTAEEEIKQGMGELYSRVNKMGLSEVSIRQVGEHIALDFPGSQALSASDLIQASSMYFHVVNEKFSSYSPTIGNAVNSFLQGVWDEACFTGTTDAGGVNAIAIKHLSRSSEGAKTLRENGLELFKKTSLSKENGINDHLSKVVIQRGSSAKDWQGLGNPLLIVFNDHVLEGSQLENIYSSYDPQRGNFLSFGVVSSLQTREGKEISPQKNLHAWTSRYSKNNILGTLNEAPSRGQGWRMAVVLNDTVISSPTLNEAIKESASISGSFSTAEVQRLCADLKAGSLSFTPRILSEKNVSPELGLADREKGIMATAVALLLVVIAMVAYYRFAGLVASLAVIFNLLILWATLQNLGATLTLAGLAGIILTVGMSIDANVLVFERIKEEQSLGKSAQNAIAAGYKKAFSAIVDSNITTIIAALILLNFDAGPVKSFAMNLIIGITSSMFTSLFVTRCYFTFWAKNPKNTLLKMSDWIRKTRFNFLKYTRASFSIALLTVAAGSFFLFSKSSSILGLDFTGGYSIHVELSPDQDRNYVEDVQKALLSKGASTQDFLVQGLSKPNELRILFGQSMEQQGKPFAGLPLEKEISKSDLLYQKNPRISWVVDTLSSSGIMIAQKNLSHLHADWTAVSGQMSDTMRNSAIIGLFLSFIAIFIYLAFRFEYKFAAAAVVCVIHDALITVALMGLLHAFGVPVQLDLITIAAIMTVIGYSLNDTIIIFDRIREEIHAKKRNLRDTINEALNFTLSRTMITSGTTLIVLFALLFLGGASIFGFALVMTMGVILGTLSSWFIAAPLVLFFQRREEKAVAIKE